jgi:hypothetical protein
MERGWYYERTVAAFLGSLHRYHATAATGIFWYLGQRSVSETSIISSRNIVRRRFPEAKKSNFDGKIITLDPVRRSARVRLLHEISPDD